MFRRWGNANKAGEKKNERNKLICKSEGKKKARKIRKGKCIEGKEYIKGENYTDLYFADTGCHKNVLKTTNLKSGRENTQLFSLFSLFFFFLSFGIMIRNIFLGALTSILRKITHEHAKLLWIKLTLHFPNLCDIRIFLHTANFLLNLS